MTSTTRPLGGKTAIVTGASRGLGREMALELAQAGANLVLLGRTDGAALQDARAQVAQLGAETLARCNARPP